MRKNTQKDRHYLPLCATFVHFVQKAHKKPIKQLLNIIVLIDVLKWLQYFKLINTNCITYSILQIFPVYFKVTGSQSHPSNGITWPPLLLVSVTHPEVLIGSRYTLQDCYLTSFYMILHCSTHLTKLRHCNLCKVP